MFSFTTDRFRKKKGPYLLRHCPCVVSLLPYQSRNNMGKDSEKNLVGQPIFNQILKFIPRAIFDGIVLGQKSDYRCRTFSTWDELVTLLFGIFERCDSAREVCDGMAALGGKIELSWDGCRPCQKYLYRCFN